MNQLYPVYTAEAECQDCYKCVRQCPAKAIKVENGRANVIPELCVGCGHCVQVCPAGAKKVRNDLGRLKQLLHDKEKVFVSLAPSWMGEFRNVPAEKMIAVLLKLGFAGVSETALGAQQVSAALAQSLSDEKRGLCISSACPAIVDYIRKYFPEYAENITPVLSPVLAHCKMLRQKYGNDIGVAMIGPCIAKKNEADAHPELLDIVLTFKDLRKWMEEECLDFESVQEGDFAFVPDRAEEGSAYPVEGGMLDNIKAYEGAEHIKGITLTGIEAIERILDSLNMGDIEDLVFVEALACRGGCVNGPCGKWKDAELVGRMKTLNNVEFPEKFLRRKPEIDMKEEYSGAKASAASASEEAMGNALSQVGKFTSDDELNCGGCGYETCRNFAQALINKKAEPAMCVSYLRNQAQKKANGLLRCIPGGVVIVDAELKIVECNEYFANMFDAGTAYAYEARPGLKGALIEKIVPLAKFIHSVLDSGEDVTREFYRVGKRLLNVTVFSIEPEQVAGLIIMDVTGAEIRRKQIAERARKVIDKNLTAVQEIACLLGEHVADTEILLRSIADDFGSDDATGKKARHE